MPCKRCGKCCIYAFLSLSVRTEENKKEMDDMGRWLAFHRCDPLIWKKGESDVLGVRIPLNCIHLDWKPDGGYFCRIYEKRPEVCKRYICENFTSSEIEEIKGKGGK